MKLSKITLLRLIIITFLSLMFISFEAYLELGVALTAVSAFYYFSRQYNS